VGDLLQTLPAVVVGTVVLWRLPMLHRDLGTRALWITLACLAFGLAFYSPPLYRAVNDLTGNPASSQIGELLGTLGAAAGVRTACLFLSGRRSSGWPWGDWIGSAATGIAVTVVLQVWPPGPVNPILHGTTYWWDSTWRSLVYCVPFLVTLTSALVSSILMWWRFGRIAPQGAVRTGLELVAAGASIGLVFVAVRLTTLIVWQLGAETRWWVDFCWVGETVTVIISGALLAWGTSWEAISAQADRGRNWWSASRAVGELEALWLALELLYPDVRMVDGRGRRWGRRALLRRVVEIRDGLMALDERADPELVGTVTTRVIRFGTGEEGTGAVVVAVTLHLAGLGTLPGAATGGALPAGGGEDLDAEVGWLRQVATAYGRPETAALAAQVRAMLVDA
jgi:hypothetical protein